jgi:hypothetical protein
VCSNLPRFSPQLQWNRLTQQSRPCVYNERQGFCRRCLLEHLATLVGAPAHCNATELKAETICAGASPGRNTNASACDRAFTSLCGAVAEGPVGACEDCVIDHAAEFIVGWGCAGDVTGFCDQQRAYVPQVASGGQP